MSQFSLTHSLTLFQSVSGSDSDATSSSTSSEPLKLTSTHVINKQLHHHYQSSHHQPNSRSNHLLELQREIKEEEDEIFALINNRSNLYASFDDDDTDNLEDQTSGLSNATTTTITNTSCQPFSLANDSKSNIELSYNLDYFQDDDDRGMGESEFTNDENSSRNQHYLSYSINDCTSVSNNNNNNLSGQHNRYHGEDYALCNRVSGQQRNLERLSAEEETLERELERQQRQQEQQQQYLKLEQEDENENHRLNDEQALLEVELAHQQQQQQHLDDYQRDLQQLTSNLPKPCVFFLEGNCRRSDCKYSHDLSSITCKYWIEGFCFKGESCPFLHRFNQKDEISSKLDDDIALEKKKLNPTFAIESEADFPSLPLDAPTVTLNASVTVDLDQDNLTKTLENQILSSNPAVVFKTTKKKRKKG